MSTMQPISGSAKKNNGGTILHAGNVGTIVNNLSLAENAVDYQYGSKVVKAVEVDSSGNLGTVQPLSGHTFAAKNDGFVVRGLTDQNIYGASRTISPASDVGLRRPIHRWQGYQRLDITSWDAETGAASFGANNGNTILPSGIDDTTGAGADDAANPTDAIPGELVYMTKGVLPTQDDYESRNG